MNQDCFERLDLYIITMLQTYDMEYVSSNYIQIREEYYINKNGG